MAFIGDSNIIQMKVHHSTVWANRNSSSPGELHSDYRFTFSPKRSDSIIMIMYHLYSQTATNHALNQYQIRDTSGNIIQSADTNGQSRANSNCTTRGQYNGDNARFINPCVTENSYSGSKTYTLYCWSWAGDIIRHNHSNGASDTTVHFGTTMKIFGYEIEDI